MNQVINLFDRKPLTNEAEGDEKAVSDYLKETVDSILSEEVVDSFIIITTNADSDILIRSSGMSRKDAFWLLTAASDHAKYGE
jgi:hypothetical protein